MCNIQRGDIFTASLGRVNKREKNSRQSGDRPVLVIQNNDGNDNGSTVIIAAISTKQNNADNLYKELLPTQLFVRRDTINNLDRNSIVMCEQIQTIDKSKLRKKIGHLSDLDLRRVNKKLMISLNLNEDDLSTDKSFRKLIRYLHRMDGSILQTYSLFDNNIELIRNTYIGGKCVCDSMNTLISKRSYKMNLLKNYCNNNEKLLEEYYKEPPSVSDIINKILNIGEN